MGTPRKPFDIVALFAALDARRHSLGMSWSQAARAISTQFAATAARPISPSTLAGLTTRRAVEGDGILQICRWLGRTPESFGDGISAGAPLPAAQPDEILRFDAASLHAALDAKRLARAATWADVAREIPGTSAASLARLARGGRVSFPEVAFITCWLECPLADFVRARPA